MSITNGIKLIHLVGSIDPDSNKFREHHFSGLDQVIHLVVLKKVLWTRGQSATKTTLLSKQFNLF